MSTKKAEDKAPPSSVGENDESVLKEKGRVADAQKPVYGDEPANRKALETPEPHVRPDLKEEQERLNKQEAEALKTNTAAAEAEKKASDKK